MNHALMCISQAIFFICDIVWSEPVKSEKIDRELSIFCSDELAGSARMKLDLREKHCDWTSA